MRHRFQGPVLLLAGSVLLLLALLSVQVTAEPPLDTSLDPDWKLVSDRNGVQVYVRHTDHSRLKTFRGVTRFPLADEYAIGAVVNDYASYPKWLYMISGATELRRNGARQRLLHATTDLPWPLEDRDAVVAIDMHQRITPQEESLTITLEDRAGVLPESEDYVRIPELHGIFRIRRLGDNEVEATYEVVLDSGGHIPAWVVNILARDVPYFTLDRLRRFVSRPEYQGRFYDYLELRGLRPADLSPPRSYLYGFPPEQPVDDLSAARTNELRQLP